MRVLICGGREFGNTELFYSTLDTYDITHIISGGARGADRLAEYYAKGKELPITIYPAQWRKYGKSAGPIRNEQMLIEGRPDLIIAFPGGKGTADMIRRAIDSGLNVVEIK